MPNNKRDNWQHHIKQVIRSRHYSWLAEARDGEPIEAVMTDVTADIMHICKQVGIPWQRLLDQSRDQFEAEEANLAQT
jgi:hypothetical protein